MSAQPGARFVSGDADTGYVVLRRDDNTTATVPDLVIFTGLTFTDNNDSTYDVTLDGS